MVDKINQHRQAFITVTSIILGFALNVAALWVPKSFLSHYVAEILLAIGTLIHIPLYIIVIYRTLNIKEKKNPETYYRTTLYLLLTGICIFYLTIVGIMIESYIVRRG